jgi:GNAT superfamily N-acetyltransferase
MHVRPAQPKDLPESVTIAISAFNDQLTDALAPYRREHPLCMRRGVLLRQKKRLYDGRHLTLAAVSDENDPWWTGQERVLGYATAIPSEGVAEASRPKPAWYSHAAIELRLLRLEELFDWYTCADRSIIRSQFFRIIQTLGRREPLKDIKRFWDIDHLSVDPALHSKGIGGMLVRNVLDIAAKDQVPVTLFASVLGKFLYTKLGFVDMGTLDLGVGGLVDAMAWYPSHFSASETPAKELDNAGDGEQAP